MKIGEYEQMMSWLTRPEAPTPIEPRENFKGGTDPKTGMGFQKGNTMGQSRDLKGKPSLNVEGKNQYTPRTTKEIQDIIDANPDYITPKNFYQPTDKMKQKGSKKLLTLTDTQNPDVIFQKKGKDPADPEKQTARNTKRKESILRQEGRQYNVKAPKGYQVHHMLPLAGNVDINTGDLAVISKKMNAKMSKYDKQINRLTTEANLLDFSKKNSLERLDNINEKLNNVLKTIKKDLPKKYKGLIGFNKLTPVFDEYGTVLNLTAEPVGVDYKKSIAGSKGLPTKDVKTSDIQKLVNNAPKFFSNPMADPGLLKQGLKDIGKFGKYAGQIALSTPAGAVLATKGLGGTFDPRTTEGRLTAGAEAAFAPGLVKGTEAFTKNKILQKVLNLGLSPKMAMRAARVASPIGIATLAGEGIYQGGKYMLERKKLLESLTDEQRDDLLSRERSEAIQQNRRGDPEAFSGIMAANGGLISRQGFADGPKDPKMNRRTFMKVMSGLASIPLLGKFIKPAAKIAESAAPVVADAPAHFWNLVAKIKTFGDDITQFGALTERQSVKKYKDLELTEDMATGQIEIQRVKVAEDMDYYGSPVTEESYMSYRPGEQIFQETANGKTKIIKSKPDYQEGTTYLRNDGPETGSVLDEMSGLSDDIFEEAGVPVPEAIRKK